MNFYVFELLVLTEAPVHVVDTPVRMCMATGGYSVHWYGYNFPNKENKK